MRRLCANCFGRPLGKFWASGHCEECRKFMCLYIQETPTMESPSLPMSAQTPSVTGSEEGLPTEVKDAHFSDVSYRCVAKGQSGNTEFEEIACVLADAFDELGPANYLHAKLFHTGSHRLFELTLTPFADRSPHDLRMGVESLLKRALQESRISRSLKSDITAYFDKYALPLKQGSETSGADRLDTDAQTPVTKENS